MATTTIPWGDGSGDNIYLTYSSASGNQTVEVTSDANTGYANRSKNITFASVVGNITKVLTVSQEGKPEEYIIFADPAVEQICATNWGDGIGLKPSQAANVTNSQFGTTFRNNTNIVSFDELIYFTGITQFSRNSFDGASSLVSITFPPNLTYINQYSFRNNQSLAKITFTRTISGAGNNFVTGMGALTRINIPSIESWMSNSWTGTSLPYSSAPSSGLHAYINGSNAEITSVTIPSTITEVKNYTFGRWAGLVSVTIHSSVTSIGTYAFYQCGSLATVVVNATTPPSLGTRAFNSNANNRKIYVPYSSDHSILNAYKAASNWSGYANDIYELNQDGTIPS